QLEAGLSGDMDEHVNILVNGRDVRYLDGNFDNLLEDGDQVSIFPALVGG
ncbi:MAG: MoaD/ThiS family protein, partial [Anaerolineales bacterium]|nr:MoaD/ThiS family protein [Anaerolineales bacterium]